MNNELSTGSLIAQKYLIERVVGIGGFGITYRAKHVQLGYVVAIKEFFITGKCIRDDDGRSIVFQDLEPERFAKYKKYFLDEAKTLASLNNPHVVHVRDILSENNTAYIVMDFVEGETLQRRVDRQGALSYNDAVNFIAQLSEAVEYIHQHHILHRDIKPDNIILTPDNKAVLIDFGSARSFVNDQVQNHTTMLTPGYAPIEQYTTTSRKGNYTDIYSMGCVFYFAVTANKPFDSAERTLNDTLASPHTLNNLFPESASRVIMKAMSIKPSDRYQDVVSFRDALLSTLPNSDVDMSSVSDPIDEQPEITQPNGNDPINEVPPKHHKLTWLWIILLVIAMVTLVYLICGRPAKPDTTYCDFSADSRGESVTINMKSKNFTVVDYPSWCTVDDESSNILHSNKSILIQAEPNYGTDERSGNIEISSKGWLTTKRYFVEIHQSGNFASYLNLSKDSYIISARGGDVPIINVYTDADIFKVTTDDDGWFFLQSDKKSFTMSSVEKYYGSSPRTAYIYVYAGDIVRSFKLIQYGNNIYVDGVQDSYDYHAGDYYLDVYSDEKWEVGVNLYTQNGRVRKISDNTLYLHLNYNSGAAYNDYFILRSKNHELRVNIHQR